MAVRRHERYAGIEADRHLRVDPGVARETLVRRDVFDDERLVPLDGDRAETRGPWNGRARRPDARFAPRPRVVDEVDLRYRRVADERRQPGQIVEHLLRLGIEDVVARQRDEPRALLVAISGHVQRPSAPRNSAASVIGSNGFTRQATAPSVSACSTSLRCVFAVRKTTGIPAVAGSALRRRQVS